MIIYMYISTSANVFEIFDIRATLGADSKMNALTELTDNTII